MEEQIREIVNKTGINYKLAKALLEFTGDTEGAIKIIQSMPKDYIALKVRFKCPKAHYYGSFYIIIHPEERAIKEIKGIVSKNSSAGDISDALFEKFKEGIVEFEEKYGSDPELFGRLQEKILSDEVVQEIFRCYSRDSFDTSKLRGIFMDIIFKVFVDEYAAVKVEEERVDILTIYRSEGKVFGEEEKEDKEEEKKEEKEVKEIKPISLVVLKIEPVVSPLKGIPVEELKYGDEIFVKIVDEREIGNYLGTLLGGKEGERLFPVKAKVIEVIKQEATGNYMVFVEFGPGVGGRMFLPQGIKIKSIEEETEAKETEEPKAKKSLKFDFFSAPYIILVAIILIIIFILFFLL